MSNNLHPPIELTQQPATRLDTKLHHHNHPPITFHALSPCHNAIFMASTHLKKTVMDSNFHQHIYRSADQCPKLSHHSQQTTNYFPNYAHWSTSRITSREQSPAKTAATSLEKSQLHTCDTSTLQHQENYLLPTTVAQPGNSPATFYTSSIVPTSNIRQTSHTVP